MTSIERRKKRYERRVNKRKENKIKRFNQLKSIEEMFRFDALIKSTKASCKGIRWKQSTQNFERRRFSNCAKIHKEIINKTYRIYEYKHFSIMERGKRREVDAPHLRDKVVQKIMCNEILKPLYEPILMYNNGASLKGKGISFSRKCLRSDLRKFFRLYGKKGKIILIDFKGFFPNAKHEIVRQRHKELIFDEEMRHMTNVVIDSIPSGMPLGIEPSQYEMIAYTSKLDSYIKCQLSMKFFGRYMDDYYIFVPPERSAYNILNKIFIRAKTSGVLINHGKTRIIPFGNKFKYCKVKYILGDNGHIHTKGCLKNYRAHRRKIKMFKRRNINLLEVYNSVQSSMSYGNQFNSDNNVRRRFYKLFKILYNFSCKVTYERWKILQPLQFVA